MYKFTFGTIFGFFFGTIFGFFLCIIAIGNILEEKEPIYGRIIDTGLFKNRISYCYTKIETAQRDTLEVLDFDLERDTGVVLLKVSKDGEYYLPFKGE